MLISQPCQARIARLYVVTGKHQRLLCSAGQIYTMKAVSSAATLCILNIKQTEAKVECLLSDYIQLQHATWSDSAQVAYACVA